MGMGGNVLGWERERERNRRGRSSFEGAVKGVFDGEGWGWGWGVRIGGGVVGSLL